MFKAHCADLVRLVRRRAPDIDVENAVADVFEVAYSSRRKVPRDKPLPWLYGTAFKTLGNVFRANDRRRAGAARVAASLPREEAPDHSDDVVSRLTIDRLLASLDAKDREIL